MTLRRLLAAVVAVPLIALTPYGAATAAPAVPTADGPTAEGPTAEATHRSARGALFNEAGETGLRRALLSYVNAAPRGSTIRVVTMSYTDPKATAALTRAHRRGVDVQVLVSQQKTEGIGTVAGLGQVLNRSTRDGSFLERIDHSARGPSRYRGRGTTLHQKSWTFSRTGSSRWVTIITSANITNEAVELQYNDGYAWVGEKARYDAMSAIFRAQRRDRPISSPFRSALGGALLFGPHDPGMSDPVVNRIDALPTRGLQIRIGVAAWSGGRGEAIARALAAKARAGASINVLVPTPFGDNVRAVLEDAGITLLRGDWTRPGNGGQYLHAKFMTAQWRTDAGRVTRVWFGSENWGDAPRGSDEVTARIDRPAAHDSWVRWFREIRL